MKRTFQYLLFLLVAAALFSIPAEAFAQNNYYNAGKSEAEKTAEDNGGKETHVDAAAGDGPRTYVVTSTSKCYAELGRKEALDIQKNYIKPYQECQHRLLLKLKEKEEAKNKAPGEKDAAPETPRNFYRVQKAVPEATEHKGPPKPIYSEEKALPER